MLSSSSRAMLAMSNPELGSLGEEIIMGIIDIADEGKQRSHSSIVGVLPELFDKVTIDPAGLYYKVLASRLHIACSQLTKSPIATL